MIKSTSTDATFGSAYCNRMATKNTTHSSIISVEINKLIKSTANNPRTMDIAYYPIDINYFCNFKHNFENTHSLFLSLFSNISLTFNIMHVSILCFEESWFNNI